MVDTLVSKASAVRREGSTPSLVTMFELRFLKLLAEEIGCQTDPDLNFQTNDDTHIAFIGLARKCWVHYVNSATVMLHFPRWEKKEIVNLEHPKSLERMEKIFHDRDWDISNMVSHKQKRVRKRDFCCVRL